MSQTKGMHPPFKEIEIAVMASRKRNDPKLSLSGSVWLSADGIWKEGMCDSGRHFVQ
jgi:hypothetical protein